MLVMTTASPERVPVRTIAATIGMVLATLVAVLFVMKVERILVWLVVALFLATALWPLVGLAQRRLRLPRSLAVSAVFLLVGIALGAIIALLVTPLVTEGSRFADQLPAYVEDARQGRGPVGDLLQRLHVDTYVHEHQDQIRKQAAGLGTSAAHVLSVIASTVLPTSASSC